MGRKNFPITIDQLFEVLAKQKSLGNGNKYILISDDEEGNGFHGCYFGISEAEDAIGEYQHHPYDLNLKNCVTLG